MKWKENRLQYGLCCVVDCGHFVDVDLWIPLGDVMVIITSLCWHHARQLDRSIPVNVCRKAWGDG